MPSWSAQGTLWPLHPGITYHTPVLQTQDIALRTFLTLKWHWLLACDAVYADRNLQIFWKNEMPPSSRWKQMISNAEKFKPDCMASYQRDKWSEWHCRGNPNFTFFKPWITRKVDFFCDFRKSIAFWKVPRLCPLVLLIKAKCRWRRVGSIGSSTR